MQTRALTPDHHVSPQIDPADAPALAEAGFTLVICNRPDEEVPPSHQAAAMEQAVRAAGMDFAVLPVRHDSLTPELIAEQAQLSSAAQAKGGKTLAYCNSGTRSSFVWALGQAGHRPVEEIMQAGAEVGYDFRPVQHLLGQQIIPG
ncbi:TIGR01244 family sulfur transferase [Rhodalgimonas zhirmunskyi]|uniref:TIGR01244 family sulfur transferase n=1 Tax=Rhodalgimonas zhirmunskyi TaxID=2964767 RepID=A0AAJ1UB81_9RHOB|nr:TIGR01244 family sulfur transferase [Rhodoalgimonas zhirmunskyi]MDQ2095310.1 TIGR01244 family sulfur transferase [Rhodoalgimonas zhirmunskyi]